MLFRATMAGLGPSLAGGKAQVLAIEDTGLSLRPVPLNLGHTLMRCWLV